MSFIMNTGNTGPVILQSLAPGMLYTPCPELNYILVCDKQVLPRNSGSTLMMMRPRAMTPPTIQLGNSGIDPVAQVPQRDVIAATIAYYGTGAVLNYQMLLQNQDSVLAWVTDRLAVSAKQAEDIILRDFIVSAASKIYAGGGSNGDNPTNLGMSDFSMVATTLDSNSARKFVSGIDGTNKFGTGPVRSSYFMLASTELQSDLDTLTGFGFLNQSNYGSNTSALISEFGSARNVRILTSPEAPVARGASSLGQDVYYNAVMGQQAVTHVEQDGESMKLLYRGPEYSGMLQQNATLAIRFAQAQAITQDTAIRILLCTRNSNLGV